MDDNSPIITKRIEDSIFIYLNRPKVLNAFSVELINALNYKLHEIQNGLEFKKVKSLIITGTGKVFRYFQSYTVEFIK